MCYLGTDKNEFFVVAGSLRFTVLQDVHLRHIDKENILCNFKDTRLKNHHFDDLGHFDKIKIRKFTKLVGKIVNTCKKYNDNFLFLCATN